MVHLLDPTGTPEELAVLGYDDRSWDQPAHLPRGQLTTAERMPSAVLEPGPAHEWPRGPELDLASIGARDPLTGRARTLDQLLCERLRSDGLLVVHRGRVVAEWYGNGMASDDLHVVHSCSKTLTTMAIGFGVDEGLLDPASPMAAYVGELAQLPAWDGVTLQHVLDMATGLDTEEHYEIPTSMYWRYADAVGYYGTAPEGRDIGLLEFVTSELTRRACPPGAVFNYASYLTNLLPIALERAYGLPACEIYESRIYRHIGAERPGLVNVDRFGRPIVEGQVNLTLRDFGRWAFLYANGGRSITGAPVLPETWVEEAFTPAPSRRDAFAASEYSALVPGGEYHNQAWLPGPDEGVLAMLGIHAQFAHIDRARDLMIVGLSSYPEQSSSLMVATLDEVWDAITREASG